MQWLSSLPWLSTEYYYYHEIPDIILRRLEVITRQEFNPLSRGICSGLASLVRSPDNKALALWSVPVVGFVAVVEHVLHAQDLP